MATIYHITTRGQWLDAVAKGQYEAASLADEGFIHCSEENQISGVLERYFSEKSDLVKLKIQTELLTSPFYFEWSPSLEATFPHIYGPINLDAVSSVEDL